MRESKFKEFCKKFVLDSSENTITSRGIDLVEDRNIKLWTAYQTLETNKKLIRATWFLAVATIILSIISLFIK